MPQPGSYCNSVFFNVIASLDLGYERQWVSENHKGKQWIIVKHWMHIECILNIHWIHIEILLNMVQ